MMNQISSKPYARFFSHLAAWIAFMFIPLMSINSPFIDPYFFLKHFINTIFLAIFFYGNTYYLIPGLLAKKKIMMYIIAILLITAVITAIHLYVEFIFNPQMYEKHWFLEVRSRGAIFSCLLILTISGGYKITNEWFFNEKIMKEMENEKLSSELMFLKNQVSPHFLFNTLNNIYSLASKKSNDAPNAIIKLSQLMRYMLYESNDRQVEIDKEIEYLKNYIDLQKLRIQDTVTIFFETKIEVQKMIEPMLLIPFVENSFKHGISNLEHSNISIRLKVNEKMLEFDVENRIPKVRGKREESSGIGLMNITRRLNLLYPGRHELKTEDLTNKYIVNLKIFFQV